MLRVKPQITEGGTVRLVVYQEVSRIDTTIAIDGAGDRAVEARARIVGRDRRQPDRRAGRAHRRPADRRQSDSVPLAGADPDRGRALPLRRAAPREDEPARVPEADRRPHGGRRPDDHVGALRLPHGRADSAGPCPSGSSGSDATQPQLPPEGVDARARPPRCRRAAAAAAGPPGGPSYWTPQDAAARRAGTCGASAPSPDRAPMPASIAAAPASFLHATRSATRSRRRKACSRSARKAARSSC